MDGSRHSPRVTGRSRPRAWSKACASSAIFASLLLAASACAAQVPPPESPDVAPSAIVAERPNKCGPLPLKWKWERQMREHGRQWGQFLDPAVNPSVDFRLASQYYDAEWVFFQISDYLGEQEPWRTYAQLAERVYRDEYLVPNNYKASGYRRFPHGLYEDMRRGGDTTASDLGALRDEPAFSRVSELLPTSESGVVTGDKEALSREVAYTLQANIIAESAGLARVEDEGKPRVYWMVQFAEKHLSQWRTQTFLTPEGRFAPFMFGLTAAALIEFIEWEEANGRDPNAAWPRDHWPTIEAALTDFATWLRFDAKVHGGELDGEQMWVSQPFPDGDFPALRYQDRHDASGSPQPAADLNLLVAPVYAWLYERTGSMVFREAADDLFAGAVSFGGAAVSGKHFNQHYRSSFKLIQWRDAGDRAHCP